MKLLKQFLKVDKRKETQYSGGYVCLSNCGQYLFCILGSTVNVLDINTGLVENRLESEEEEVTCVCISPNDKHLITAHRSLLMKQWDNWRKSNEQGKTNKCTRTWKAIHTAPVQFMCFDSSSTLLASASSDFTVKVWDINAQYCTHNLKGATGIVRCVRFYPQIEQVPQCVTGGEDGKLRVYNLRTSNMDACLEAHFSSITCFEYVFNETSARYDKLCSSSRDKVIIVWDLQTFTKQRTIPIYESIESFVMLSQVFATHQALSRFVITMGNQGILKLWDTKTGRLLNKQAESESFKLENRKNKSEQELSDELVIIQSDYHAKLNRLTLVTSDQLVVFVEIDKSTLEQSLIRNEKELNEEENLFHVRKQFIGDHGEILDTQLCGENLLAMATNSPLIKLYNINTWDCKLMKGHTDLVICLSVFIDKHHRTFLASSSKDSTIRIWRIKHNVDSDTSSYECVAMLNGHTQDVGALDFSNLGFDFLVSGSIDTTVKLWRITSTNSEHKSVESTNYTFNVAYTIRAHEKDINGLCVSPNDRLIASCSSDKTAKIWNSSDGTCLGVLRGHKRGIWCVQFSPVDQMVATSSADGTVRFWSLDDFSCTKTFEGHNTSVLKLHFLNNGTQFVSTGSDGLVKLWNIKTNECVGTFDEHEDKAWALCVSANEEKIITGGADGKLVVWKDVTSEHREEELEQREEILLKEQELSNFLKEKKWKKALALSIHLNKPFKCYQIIKEILQQNTSKWDDEEFILKNDRKNRLDLENTLLKLRDDQIKSLIKYGVEWNTNTKFCHIAQILFEIIFRNYPPDFLIDEENQDSEFATKLVEQFMPYTERHFSRVNKLAQQVMFIDFAWQNMKLENNLNAQS